MSRDLPGVTVVAATWYDAEDMGGTQSKGEFFADFPAPHSALDDAMEESQQVRQIKPKSAIDTACIQTAAQHRVMPLDQHAAFAFETVHRASARTSGDKGVESALSHLFRSIASPSSPAWPFL